MKLGLSTYSLDREIRVGNMSLLEVVDWAAANGAEHIELVPFAYKFSDGAGNIDTAMIAALKKRASDAGIYLSNYSVLANLLMDDAEQQRAEIRRVMHHVDIAHELGVNKMRHDISAFRRPLELNTIAHYMKDLPRMAESAQTIADYAKGKGVCTLLENHGFYVNGSDRVLMLLAQVARDNYGLLWDTGNTACMDEDPAAAAMHLAPHARMVHLKDFYVRRQDPGDSTQFDCGGSWFRSLTGSYLRGSIFGQGDLDTRAILSRLKHSGYAGEIAIEFEGMEPAQYASRVSLDNARRIWNEA